MKSKGAMGASDASLVVDATGSRIRDQTSYLKKSLAILGALLLLAFLILSKYCQAFEDAIDKKIREVEIIPGKGSGQLRKKVERLLEKCHERFPAQAPSYIIYNPEAILPHSREEVNVSGGSLP